MTDERAPTDHDLMRVGLSTTDRMVLVNVAGEVDMLTAHGLWAVIDHAVSKAGGRPVAVDLNGVLFLGSHGVAALERATASARCANVEVRLVVAPGRPARRILELTGLDRIFTVSDASDEAS